MPPYHLTNFEIQKYYKDDALLSSTNEPKFNVVYSRNNLHKWNDGAYVIALYVNDNIVTYFNSFRVENNPKEIKAFIGNKNITFIENICRIQVYNLKVCENFCIGFIGFMLKGKNLLDYTNLFLLMIMSRMIK